ncbi:147_t:CDS:2, partial [Paraglomus brasilianum]
NEVLSSNLSCSSLEIRAVNAEISSALDVKLNSPAERVKSLVSKVTCLHSTWNAFNSRLYNLKSVSLSNALS